MAHILNIETALGEARISIAKDGLVIASDSNPTQTDHASWMHVAIEKLVNDSTIAMSDLDAIAVSNGPGSYTGLRVGLSAAKGFCYALNKPLITLNTLELMAFSAIRRLDTDQHTSPVLFCPMIDARRMEVFMAIYDGDRKEVTKPSAMILDQHSFSELLENHKIYFFGNGSAKMKTVVSNQNAFFLDADTDASDLAMLSYSYLRDGKFADTAYAEPFYVKDFYTPSGGFS